MLPTPDVQGLHGGFLHRNRPGPADRVSGRIDFLRCVDMRDTRTMSQYAHARAIHLLEDTGLDPDDARYVMKRLYDMGFVHQDPGTRERGVSPPAHPRKTARAQHRSDLMAQMRAETARARQEKAEELEAAIVAQREREAAEKAAQERQLAVQAVLAGMEQ